MAGVDARGPAMAVSKAPAPPPGLEAPPASSHMSAQNFQAYAYAQQSWTPMGNLPPTMQHSADHSTPSMPWGPHGTGGYGYAGGKMNNVAKAALNLFQGGAGTQPEERQRLEQMAKANARRLQNSPLNKAKAAAPQVNGTAGNGSVPNGANGAVPPARPSTLQSGASKPPDRLQADRDEMPSNDQAGQSSSGATRYTGILKVFKPESGYGFIDCEEVKKMYPGCDVFMNQGIEGGILVGSQVSFALEVSANGKPQARDARLEAPSSELEPEPSPQPSELLGKVLKGVVKSFNVSRGFGFITSKELMGTPFSGRDVFVSVSQVAGNCPLSTGYEVEFTFAMSQQGQPQAKDVKLMNDAPELDYLGELPTAQSVGDKLLRMG